MDEKQIRRAASKKKLAILVVAVVVAALFVIGYGLSENVKSESPSLVVVAVRGYLSLEQKDALERQFNAYAPREGPAVALEVYEFPAESKDAKTGAELLRRLKEELHAGHANLLLFDNYVYDLLGDDTLFEELSTKFPGDPAVLDRYRYALVHKSFWSGELTSMPQVYLSLRNQGMEAVNKNQKTREEYAFAAELLNNIAREKQP